VVFETDYDKIELQKYSYDVITITSPKNVTKITSQKILQSGPLPIKISGYASSWGGTTDKLALTVKISLTFDFRSSLLFRAGIQDALNCKQTPKFFR